MLKDKRVIFFSCTRHVQIRFWFLASFGTGRKYQLGNCLLNSNLMWNFALKMGPFLASLVSLLCLLLLNLRVHTCASFLENFRASLKPFFGSQCLLYFKSPYNCCFSILLSFIQMTNRQITFFLFFPCDWLQIKYSDA